MCKWQCTDPRGLPVRPTISHQAQFPAPNTQQSLNTKEGSFVPALENLLFTHQINISSTRTVTNLTMDERAKIPVSLPCANPTVSYWQDPPDDLADHRSTPDLPEFVDTVIIGSGITGAAVAWGLLQGPNPGSILMLEARQACSGATGRNGEYILYAHPRNSYPTSHSHLPRSPTSFTYLLHPPPRSPSL